MGVQFTVPGYPQPKQRHRFIKKTGRSYTPQQTVDFEAKVGAAAAPHFIRPMVGPVRLTVAVTFKMAASWSNKKRLAMLGQPHTQRPDLSNIVKAVEDGMNEIAFKDDGQVATGAQSKVWGEVDQTIVTVEPI